MNIKRLLKHTIILLRTALLLGAVILVNTQAQAQTAEQLAAMPNAFQTVTPTINDGQYYYIQFYYDGPISYLNDRGANKRASIADFLPSNNRLWTLVDAGDGDATHFKLKSKAGHYIGLLNKPENSSGDRYVCLESGHASIATFTLQTNGDGYNLFDVYNNYDADHQNCFLGRPNNTEWSDQLSKIRVENSGRQNSRMRFVKLKSNAAFIIYYREEGIDNSAPNSLTTRHYLTYSGTGNPPAAGTEGLRNSTVSSRQSIIPSDKLLRTLPTVAVYHQDGLWTLEEGSTDGEFFIKKYGSTEEYLNPSGTLSILGNKDLEYGKYTLEDPTANRYTCIVNTSNYDFAELSSSHFYQWDKTTAGAASQAKATVTFNAGNNTEIGNRVTVVGTDEVWYHTYADMTGCKKLVIEGTPGMYLRVLLNRQVPIDPSEQSYDSHGGDYVERYCTLDENGRGELDVSDLPYVHINAIKNWGSAGKVNSIDVLRPKLESVALAQSQFHFWNDLDGVSVNTENPNDVEFHVNDGQNVSPSNNLVAGTGSVYYLTYANLPGSKKLVIKGTTGMILRVILNRQEPITQGEQGYDQNGGSFIERVTTIGSNGYAEVDLSDLSYVHLNSIKARSDSPSGTITEINLIRLAANGDVRYLHHSNGDGWQVPQWTNKWNDLWHAAFYPVEVPVSGKDEFFQVLVGLREGLVANKKIELTGTVGMTVSDQDYTDGHLYGATFTPTDAYQNAFKLINLNTGSYQQIVIKFGSPVPTGGWTLHTYGGQWDGNVPLEVGTTEYTITLQPGRNIDDFTIYNTVANASPIKISEIIYLPDLPSEMVNHSGIASPYSELEEEQQLWHLEQYDDYKHFFLKNPDENTSNLFLMGLLNQMTEQMLRNIQTFLF